MILIILAIIALSIFIFMRTKQIRRSNDRKERLEEKLKELGESLKNNLTKDK
jgi:hypothetical protein